MTELEAEREFPPFHCSTYLCVRTYAHSGVAQPERIGSSSAPSRGREVRIGTSSRQRGVCDRASLARAAVVTRFPDVGVFYRVVPRSGGPPVCQP